MKLRLRAFRFIPAGAGNTIAGALLYDLNPVYPRWRGEHQINSMFYGYCLGLSPLARGTPTAENAVLKTTRFIPAGAGNTNPVARSMKKSAVYPRWRGEHPGISYLSIKHIGLSPLARGTHEPPTAPVYFTRFIPAGAGNTGCAAIVDSPSAVYPRWRGEHWGRVTRFL